VTIGTANKQDGFTLVETLVALALLALISVYGLTALSFSRAYDRVGRKIELAMNEDLALERIRELMSQFQFINSDIDKPPTFLGRKDKLQFLAISDGKSIPGGLYQVQMLKSDDGRLLLQWQSFPLNSGNEIMNEVSVLNDVAELYLGYSAAWTSETYFDTWTAHESFPRALRFQVQRTDTESASRKKDVLRIFVFGAGP
jgi:general secretion pathway protein J